MGGTSDSTWKATACGLCYANCGVLVQTGGDDGRRILRVKGEKGASGVARLHLQHGAEARLLRQRTRSVDGSAASARRRYV